MGKVYKWSHFLQGKSSISLPSSSAGVDSAIFLTAQRCIFGSARYPPAKYPVPVSVFDPQGLSIPQAKLVPSSYGIPATRARSRPVSAVCCGSRRRAGSAAAPGGPGALLLNFSSLPPSPVKGMVCAVISPRLVLAPLFS